MTHQEKVLKASEIVNSAIEAMDQHDEPYVYLIAEMERAVALLKEPGHPSPPAGSTLGPSPNGVPLDTSRIPTEAPKENS